VAEGQENLADSSFPASGRNIKIVVEYDGSDYFGFQRIPGRRTIQGELELALTRITKEPVKVAGAGRTDAGVHAAGQVVSFRTQGTIPTDRIAVAMNSLLPKDIVAKEATEVAPEFHARFSAQSRCYRYLVMNTEMPSGIFGRFSWHVPYVLNVRSMKAAARHLAGVHDFTSFSVPDQDPQRRVRDLRQLTVRRCGEFVAFEMVANGFLRSMARIVVGTLVEVGQGKRKAAEVREILEARDRRLAGITAPAKGLVLMGVKY
jgi:tRNA pseudouridine38-40 synthase